MKCHLTIFHRTRLVSTENAPADAGGRLAGGYGIVRARRSRALLPRVRKLASDFVGFCLMTW